MAYSKGDVITGYQYRENILLKVWEAYLQQNGYRFCFQGAETSTGNSTTIFSESNPLALQKQAVIVIKENNAPLQIGGRICILADAFGIDDGHAVLRQMNCMAQIKKLISAYREGFNSAPKPTQFKALFPFNAGSNHWNLGELDLDVCDVFGQGEYFAVNLKLVEPLYTEERCEALHKAGTYGLLVSEIADKFTTLKAEDFHITCTQQQHAERGRGAVSCGAICAENGLTRLQNAEIDVAEQYPYGAPDIRLQHLNLVNVGVFCSAQEDNTSYHAVLGRISTVSASEPATSTSGIDDDDSSDEETCDEVSKYNMQEQWEAFQKSAFYEELREHCKKAAIFSLFAVSAASLKMLYSPEVQLPYYTNGKKAALGKTTYPPGYEQNLRNWLESAIHKTLLKVVFNKQDKESNNAQDLDDYLKATNVAKELDVTQATESLTNGETISAFVNSLSQSELHTLFKTVVAEHKELNSRYHDALKILMTKNKGFFTREEFQTIREATALHLSSATDTTPQEAQLSSLQQVKRNVSTPEVEATILQLASPKLYSQDEPDSATSICDQLIQFNKADLLHLTHRSPAKEDTLDHEHSLFDNALYQILYQLIKATPEKFIWSPGVRSNHIYSITSSFVDALVGIRSENRIHKRLINKMGLRAMIKETQRSLKLISTWQFGFDLAAHDQAQLSSNQVRTNLVLLGGSYKALRDKVTHVTTACGVSDPDIAKLVLKVVSGGSIYNEEGVIKITDDKFIDSSEAVAEGLLAIVTELAHLLLICEPMRYPAAFLTHLMGLFLIANGHHTFAEMLYIEDTASPEETDDIKDTSKTSEGDSKPEEKTSDTKDYTKATTEKSGKVKASKGKKKPAETGSGMLPMTMKEIVSRTHRLQTKLREFMPFGYQYESADNGGIEQIAEFIRKTFVIVITFCRHYSTLLRSKDPLIQASLQYFVEAFNNIIEHDPAMQVEIQHQHDKEFGLSTWVFRENVLLQQQGQLPEASLVDVFSDLAI